MQMALIKMIIYILVTSNYPLLQDIKNFLPQSLGVHQEIN